MRPFEEEVAAELLVLLRAGVPPRGVRLTVREIVVARFERGPIGALEVTGTVEATVRAACQLVRQIGAAEDLVETVCRGALEAVRGHGGETTRWLPHATRTTFDLLEALARERAEEPAWRWLSRQVSGW